MTTGPSTTQTPYLVASEPNVTFTSLLSAGDSVGGYRMIGVPDGIGAFANPNGTVTVLMNNELAANLGAVHAHGSAGAVVESLVIDPATLRVISDQDLADQVFLNPDGSGFTAATTAWQRFCSGDLAPANAYLDPVHGLGTSARIYLTGEEAADGRAFAFVMDAAGHAKAYELPSLGNLAFENIVVAPGRGAKTVAMLDDDTSPGGQVYMYLGDKRATGLDVEKAGLTGGQLFGVKVDGLATESSGSFLPNNAAHFSMVGLGDVSKLSGAGLESASDASGVTKFFRPEDGAWDPSHPNWYYFVTTADNNSNSKLWRLEFVDPTNPSAGGTIRNLLQGDEGQRMMDNITVSADGKLTIVEDPGNAARLAKVWQYDPATDTLTQMAEHDPARFSGTTPPFTQDEESSGVVDVTSLFGSGAIRTYLLDVQAHYTYPDPAIAEGGQLLLMSVTQPSNGGQGADTVNGSGGVDTLFGLGGDDTIRGGSGDDFVSGDLGNDTVNGNAGSDKVYGVAGDDMLRGGRGDDTLDGGAGADTLFGDLGNDVLTGGAGADRFVAQPTGGVDWVTDFHASEGDKVLVAAGTAYTVVSIQGQAALDFGGGNVLGLVGVSVAQAGDWLATA